MLEKWTNTSSPCSREMKPKPFSALKNFTVPVAKPLSLLMLSRSCIDSSEQTTGRGSGRHTFPAAMGRTPLCDGIPQRKIVQGRKAVIDAFADDVGHGPYLR